MRNIRRDLQERVNLIEERIRAADAHCEKMVKQLQDERDATVADLKSVIAMIIELLEIERQPLDNAPPASPQLSLADFFERKLIDIGPMSKNDLRNLAMKEGYFPEAESDCQSVDATLEDIIGKKRICQLPDGTFASPTRSQAIRLRRVI